MFKKAIKYFRDVFQSEKQKETEYYKKLFIETPYWNGTNPNEEERIRWEIIETFIKSISLEKNIGSYNILDLGCGRGWLSNLLSSYGNVVGLEPIEPVVEYARKIFPGINFICGTSKTLLKQNKHKQFDLIVSSEVIEHIPDKKKQQYLKDIFQLLNDKGHLILTTPRKEAQQEWIKYGDINQPIEDWISESELESLLISNNFIKVKLDRFSISPIPSAPKIEIYQLWLFQKK